MADQLLTPSVLSLLPFCQVVLLNPWDIAVPNDSAVHLEHSSVSLSFKTIS